MRVEKTIVLSKPRKVKVMTDRELASNLIFDELAKRFLERQNIIPYSRTLEALSSLLDLVHDVSYESGSENPFY